MDYDRKLLFDMGFKKIEYKDGYPPDGELYLNEPDDGIYRYWMYEGEDFTLNIHDFYLSEDSIFHFDRPDNLGTQVSISYLVDVSGDLFLPKRSINSGSIVAYFLGAHTFRGILHKNSKFLSVGFEYKDGYLDRNFCPKYGISFSDVKNAIDMLNLRPECFSLNKFANELLFYKKKSPATNFFYEGLAQNVLLNILHNYYELLEKTLPKDDVLALELVKETLDEHYMMDLKLDFLAQIAMMSKSKLKMRFKEQYFMTITEYTQRRRLNVAKHLMSTTDLSLSNVAKAVGYNSHSRFSALFKRYYNITPNEYLKGKLK